MSKRDKRKAQAEAPKPGIALDAVLAWIIETKGTLQAARKKNPETCLTGEGDIKACDAIADILTALKAEGIQDGEQVRDLIHDYDALAQQYQALHHKYEVGERPQRLGNKVSICPACHQQQRPGNNNCWNCGHRLIWGK